MIITAKHPTGLTVTFNEEKHLYSVLETGQSLVSSTTFISKFFPKFDSEKIANNIAAKRNTTPEKLLDDWKKNSEIACKTGTNVHLYAEKLICGEQLPPPKTSREKRLFDQAARAIVSLLKRFKFVAAEKIVFSPFLGIAGMVDLIMYDPQKNNMIIIDWKQNKNIDRDNVWQNGHEPITYMDACSLNKYKLQLNLYQFILNDEKYYPDVNDYRRLLIHLKEDKFYGIAIDDLQDIVSDLVYYTI